jgi:ribonuclease HII
LAQIRRDYHEIIIDGTIALIDDPRVTLLKKADLLIPSVSAASIVATGARDNYMKHLDLVFPGYKFAGHMGYGTVAHRAAIELQGVTPLHRLSYAPLAQYAVKEVRAGDVVVAKPKTSKSIGDAAETVAA